MSVSTRSLSARVGRLGSLILALSLALLFIAPAADAGTVKGSVAVRIISINDLHGNLQPPAGSSGRVRPGRRNDGRRRRRRLPRHPREAAEGRGPELVRSSPRATTSARRRWPRRCSTTSPPSTVLNAIGRQGLGRRQPRVRRGLQGAAADPVRRLPPDRRLPVPRHLRRREVPLPRGERDLQERPARRAALHRPLRGRRADRHHRRHPAGPARVVVRRARIKGLKFGDEVQAINRTSNLLDRLGVKAQVVLMHQGDETERWRPERLQRSSRRRRPERSPRPLRPRSTPSSPATATSSTTAWSPTRPGKPRPLIQGLSFGRLLSVVDLQDRHAGPTTSSGRQTWRTTRSSPATSPPTRRCRRSSTGRWPRRPRSRTGRSAPSPPTCPGRRHRPVSRRWAT